VRQEKEAPTDAPIRARDGSGRRGRCAPPSSELLLLEEEENMAVVVLLLVVRPCRLAGAAAAACVRPCDLRRRSRAWEDACGIIRWISQISRSTSWSGMGLGLTIAVCDDCVERSSAASGVCGCVC
jgi:hypothetical protein